METALLWFIILCLPLIWGKNQLEMDISRLTGNYSSAWVHRSQLDYSLRLPRAAGIPSKMKRSDQVEITRLHNLYRSMVDPSATDMEYMEWDDRIASIAQQWSEGCTWKHGNPSHDWNDGLGQNLYRGWNSSGSYAMRLWYEEYVDYNIHINRCNPGKQCGHYTQIVWSKTRLVGCGIKEGCWGDYRYYIVCNYWPQGNYIGQKPYKIGEPCSHCDEKSPLCWNKTCVNWPQCEKYNLKCGCAMICHNCGKLDRESCSCKCNDGWKGRSCTEACADKTKGCSPLMCLYYENSKDHPCEKTCNICKSVNPDDLRNTCCGGIICPPGQVLDLSDRPCECIPLCTGPKCGSLFHEPYFTLLVVAISFLGYNAR